MSELISGKEALIALANGETVEVADSEVDVPWTEICVKNNDFLGKAEPCLWMFINTPSHIQFRLKPRTITINEIEVPSVKYVAHSGGNCVKISCECPEDAAAIGAALRSVFGKK